MNLTKPLMMKLLTLTTSHPYSPSLLFGVVCKSCQQFSKSLRKFVKLHHWLATKCKTMSIRQIISNFRNLRKFVKLHNTLKLHSAKPYKIMLHRIISVVWLTNFLSEILNWSTHDDELNNFLWAWRGGWALSRAQSRWWSLTLPGGGWRRELSSEWSGSWKGFSSHSYT